MPPADALFFFLIQLPLIHFPLATMAADGISPSPLPHCFFPLRSSLPVSRFSNFSSNRKRDILFDPHQICRMLHLPQMSPLKKLILFSPFPSYCSFLSVFLRLKKLFLFSPFQRLRHGVIVDRSLYIPFTGIRFFFSRPTQCFFSSASPRPPALRTLFEDNIVSFRTLFFFAPCPPPTGGLSNPSNRAQNVLAPPLEMLIPQINSSFPPVCLFHPSFTFSAQRHWWVSFHTHVPPPFSGLPMQRCLISFRTGFCPPRLVFLPPPRIFHSSIWLLSST